MADYRPALPFTTAMILLKPTQTTVNGVHKKTYQSVAQGTQFFGTFKTYGGTEKTVDGIYSVEDTAEIETWYTPDITSGCAVVIAGTTEQYEIINTPENINRRNQFLKFKVRRVRGGA